jgi:signal recognition particle subunit SRP54
MFDSISTSLQKVFQKFGRGGRLTEQNIQEGLREIRTALLEADVNFKVARDLIKEVTKRAVGEEVIKSVTPGQMIVKIFQDVLTEMMGPTSSKIEFAENPPTIIMMAGLQGSGKTTTCAKLGSLLKKKGRNPMMVAADVQRPAAVDQLKILGNQLDIPVFHQPGMSPPLICAESISHAAAGGRDVVILDTAGRLHIDEPLMMELEEIVNAVNPHQVLLVCDAMTGQDAVNSAKEFNDRLELDGVVLTKLDGDTRGGAAISVKTVTGKPIKFAGMGEKLDDLEEFHPDRMASRILGMGDVVSLVEKAQEVIDQETAEEQMKKLFEAEFTFEDFLAQIQSVKKLGSLKDLLGHLPGGLGSQFKDAGVDDKAMVRLEAIIQSMTPEEKLKPDLFNVSRKRRVAKGSGTSLAEVNDLLKQFNQMRTLMKKQKSAGGIGGMMGRMASKIMPGMGLGGAMEEKNAMVEKLHARGKLDGGNRSSQDAKKRKAKRKAERQRRRKSRKK